VPCGAPSEGITSGVPRRSPSPPRLASNLEQVHRGADEFGPAEPQGITARFGSDEARRGRSTSDMDRRSVFRYGS